MPIIGFGGGFGSSGSGSGTSYIDGTVPTPADLPITTGTPAQNSVYLAKAPSGIYFITRKPAGLYCRTADLGSISDWTYLGAFPEVNSDANWRLYNDTTTSKQLAFDLSGITTATTRTLTVPNASGTIALTSTFAAPPAIGNTTAAAGSFTTLGASGTMTAATSAVTPPTNITDARGIQWANVGGATNQTGIWSGYAGVPIVGIGIGTGSGSLTEVARFTSAGFILAGNASRSVTFAAPSTLTASRTYSLPDNTGTLALTSDLPSGGSKTYLRAIARDNQPPSSSFATLDTRNSIAILDFDDAATESAVFVGTIPEGASLASGLIVRLHFMATTATSGNVRWSVAFERSNTDLDADSFDTAVAATTATSATSGIVTVSSITCTTIDSVTAGDLFRVRVQRLGADAADTMTGDAELVAVEVRSAA